MNNKSFYALITLVAIIDLVLVVRPVTYGTLATRSILCGGALYYVVQILRNKERITIYFPFMVIFAVLYNPVAPFILPEWSWLLLDIVSLAVFYILSRSTILLGGVTHKDPINASRDKNSQDQ